jgi:cleavage and polyadenylation specificity factor subunit 1
MHALHQEILPPSGVEFATSLKLTPATLEPTSSPTIPQEFATRTLCNVVVARSNILHIFEVREEPAPISVEAEERESISMPTRRYSQSTGRSTGLRPHTVTRFYFVREHHLHGVVTGLEGVKVLASIDDGLDRLLISFKDAKVNYSLDSLTLTYVP